MAKYWIFGLVFLLMIASAMAAVPEVTWLNQTPSDITTTNLVSSALTVFFNITDDVGINQSTIIIYAKTNTSTSDVFYVENNISYTGYNETEVYTANYTDVYKWSLYDNDIYPGVYNFNWHYTRNAAHSSASLANDNNWLWVELLGVSASKGENYFEIMINNSAGTDYGKIYYCNSTYATGNPTSSTSCVLIYNIPTNTYNHCHTVNACHMLAPFSVVAGKVGSVDITQTSRFLVQGRTGSTVNYWYITNSSHTGATKTSINSGVTWTTQTYTVDSHIHQYDGTDTYYYYACASDNTNTTCSSVITNKLAAGDVPSIPTTHTNYFAEDSCPVSDTPSTMMYIFIGIMIIGLFVLGETLFNAMPVFSIVPSLAMVFYSFPMYGCHLIYGAMLTIFGVLMLLWSWQKASQMLGWSG